MKAVGFNKLIRLSSKVPRVSRIQVQMQRKEIRIRQEIIEITRLAGKLEPELLSFCLGDVPDIHR